jgi:hypothetical protein
MGVFFRPSGATRTDPDDVDDFLETLDGLLSDARYRFAETTIRGIADTVAATRRVTEGQARAIGNITRSVDEKDDGRRWGRRYEGA